jgi:hypothetical protein
MRSARDRPDLSGRGGWTSARGGSKGALAFSALLGCLSATASAFAEQVPLRVHGGERRVSELPAQSPQPKASDAQKPAPPNHRRGPRPKTPAATLPEDVPLAEPSERARRAIAEGEPRQHLAKGAPEEQLVLLRAAERVLFPEPVRGISPGWSFALPRAQAEGHAGLGLPLRGKAQEAEVESEADVAGSRA